jgi:UDPglucose 6-dehydrogenase
MTILVIGMGYVGTATALTLAELGWKVTGLDTDEQKIGMLSRGVLPFYEPGLDHLLEKHIGSNQICFSSDTAKAIREHQVIFICVGTPSTDDGHADISYLERAARDIGRSMDSYKLIVIKSTVPVGTGRRVRQWITEMQPYAQAFDVIANPEFLREGSALQDALKPDRIIIGSDCERAAFMLVRLYHSMECPIIHTSPETAEFIKYAANAFLATKISYMNELARLCDRLGVKITDVSEGIGLDHRIGASFLNAGIGYGGSCFPKDVKALLNTAKENGIELSILDRVVNVNNSQYIYVLDQARNLLGSFQNRTIAVLGLTFKPDTDDTREAPSLRLIRQLLDEDAYVRVHDPVASIPRDWQSPRLRQVPTPEMAAERADAIFICTEWPCYQSLNWTRLRQEMNHACVFDGRNMLSSVEMKRQGFHYQGVGY